MFLARVKVIINIDRSEHEPDKWQRLFIQNEKECRWRYRKNHEIEFILGPYTNRFIALHEGKRLFINVHFNAYRSLIGFDMGCAMYLPNFSNNTGSSFEEYMEQEEFYFWTKSHYANFPGLTVFEIDKSLDDYDHYYHKYLHGVLPAETNAGITNHRTPSDDENQIFNVFSIDNAYHDERISVPIICSLLERMAKVEMMAEESPGIISSLKKLIKKTDMRRTEEEELVEFLNSRKKEIARMNCLKMINRHTKKTYGGYTAQKVFEDSFDLNDHILSGTPWEKRDYSASTYLVALFLDVFNAKNTNY